MTQSIIEGKATIQGHTATIVSKDLPVFYNPLMKYNRDISLAIIKALPVKNLRICDPMAASGIRAIRFIKELPTSKINEIHANDYDPVAVKLLKTNIKKNNVKKIKVSQQDANVLLLQSEGYDYIDIDPFGSPNQFLDAACKRIAREGILAVTATDTAPLCGTYPTTCKRKYWATPNKSPWMHELGLRILIRKVQLIGAQYEKALMPFFTYSKDHYFRFFFKAVKGKKRADELLKQHGMLRDAGPLWTGRLWDPVLTPKIVKHALPLVDEQEKRFTEILGQESQIDSPCFSHIHFMCKGKRQSIKSHEEIIKHIKKKKHDASLTHFTGEGIRTSMSEAQLMKLL